jgi:hypothetical protein
MSVTLAPELTEAIKDRPTGRDCRLISDGYCARIEAAGA